MKLSEKLTNIQNELKAPKNMYNSFGKYKYRNLESILECVKPLLVKHRCSLTISDTVQAVGDRVYIVATAVLGDLDSDETVTVTAMARESVAKKGMDDSQVTGATSSYARKYCMNGLFLIDDTKDADTDEFQNQTTKEKNGQRKPTEEQIKALSNVIERKGLSLMDMLKRVNKKNVFEITCDDYNKIVVMLRDM